MLRINSSVSRRTSSISEYIMGDITLTSLLEVFIQNVDADLTPVSTVRVGSDDDVGRKSKSTPLGLSGSALEEWFDEGVVRR